MFSLNIVIAKLILMTSNNDVLLVQQIISVIENNVEKVLKTSHNYRFGLISNNVSDRKEHNYVRSTKHIC